MLSQSPFLPTLAMSRGSKAQSADHGDFLGFLATVAATAAWQMISTTWGQPGGKLGAGIAGMFEMDHGTIRSVAPEPPEVGVAPSPGK